MRQRLSRLGLGRLLRAFLATRGCVEAPLYGEWRELLSTISESRRRVPLLMNDMAALQLLVCVRAAARLNGSMAEAGVLKGGSARLICEAKGAAPLHLFDLFEGVHEEPPDSELRRRFNRIHGVRDDVADLLGGYPQVQLHPGLFPGSIPSELFESQFSFVHIDLDLPDGIRAALEFFHPRMAPGGIIIGDDFFDLAVRETFGAFFRSRGDTLIELPWGQIMVVKQGAAEWADQLAETAIIPRIAG